MADSFFKKENNKKKTLIKKQKAQKRQERKTSNNKGKGFESMIVYVDRNGHFTDTPPDTLAPTSKPTPKILPSRQ